MSICHGFFPLELEVRESSFHRKGPRCPVWGQNREGCIWSQGQGGRHENLGQPRQVKDIEEQWKHPMSLKRISKKVGKENFLPKGGAVIVIKPL